MARRDDSQGWMGAVVVGGLILFAIFFLKPTNNRRRPQTHENTADDLARHESTPDYRPPEDDFVDSRRTHTVGHVDATEARALLSRVAATYADARSYRDRTVMQIVRASEPTRPLEKADILVEFERPNRIRVDVNRDRDQLVLLSDGSQMFARIIDPGTNNFDNQLVVKPAPPALTLQSLYELCEYTKFDQPEQRHSALMSLPAPLIVSQLSLLFDADAMSQFVAGADRIEQLPQQRFHGLPSERIRITTVGGEFVFWIDPYSAQLQRIEFPPPGDHADHDLSGTGHRREPELQLTAEFRDRRFNEPLRSSAFNLPVSQASQPVRNFILPPEDRSADLLGRVIRSYWFTDLYGARKDDRDWENQISVLVWFGNHPASRAVLLETQEAATAYERDNRVNFLAVCVEPSTGFSHRQVDDLVRSWSVRLPVVRDLEAFGRDIFRIQRAPTLVVMDAQNRVQLVEIGGSTRLDEQLGNVIERLLSGEDLAQRYLDHLDEQRRSYERLLTDARLPRDQFIEPRLGRPSR